MTETENCNQPIIEGKTKIIFSDADDNVIVFSNDNITAGDGARQNKIPGKGALSTKTTCQVFSLLKACGIPIAFHRQISETTFSAPSCTMLPYEVVIRRKPLGSYLKRHPDTSRDTVFSPLLLEFFLKTKDRQWKNHQLVCDDPYLIHDHEAKKIRLYDPKKPASDKPFLVLSEDEVFTQKNEVDLLFHMSRIARQTFLILEKAWQLQEHQLIDFKVEFGLTRNGELLLADVIDNDSWRVLDNTGTHIDKQLYRNGQDLDVVKTKFELAAELTSRFRIPRQSLTLLHAGEDHELDPFYDQIKYLGLNSIFSTHAIHFGSEDKEESHEKLRQHLKENPNTIIIAFFDLNDLEVLDWPNDPLIPTILVPAFKEVSDAMGYLTIPGKSTHMTVHDPDMAIQAALGICARDNPLVYAILKYEEEGSPVIY